MTDLGHRTPGTAPAADGTAASPGTVWPILRRRWPLILAIVVASVAVALIRYHASPRMYDATASVTYDNTTLSDQAMAITQGTVDPTRDGATNVVVATSPVVATAVKQALHSPASPADLVRQVSVQALPNANVLQITASTGNPRYSAQLANAFAAAYQNYAMTSQINGISAAYLQLEQQLAGLPAGSPSRSSIEQSMQHLEALRGVADGGIQIIGQASPPSSPSGLSQTTSVILGLLIGLAVALLVVFGLQSLDHRLDSIEAIEREYGLKSVALIPQRAFRGQRVVDRRGALDPYRILRTSLDLAAAARPIDVVLVTSSRSGEGKTTVAVDLAHTIALSDRPVTLVELDLRRPTFGQQFELDPRRGFTSVLAGHAHLADVIVRPVPKLPGLSVLPSGPLPGDPAELLESAAAADLLEQIKEMAEGLVILDTPPLNPVADTHVLLANPTVDAALLVARARFLTSADIRRSRMILDRQMLHPLGIVVTGVDVPGGYGYDAYRSFPRLAGEDEPGASARRRFGWPARRSARPARPGAGNGSAPNGAQAPLPSVAVTDRDVDRD